MARLVGRRESVRGATVETATVETNTLDVSKRALSRIPDGSRLAPDDECSKRFGCALLAPLDCDTHSGIECERHAAFRRLFLAEVMPSNCCSRYRLARLQLALPGEGPLEGIFPFTGDAPERGFFAAAKSTMIRGVKLLLQELLATNFASVRLR